MRRILTALLPIFAAAIVLASCGGDDDESTPSPSLSPTPTTMQSASPTPTAIKTPTPTQSPAPQVSLYDALSSPSEVSPTRPLDNGALVYAYKEGTRVTVVARDLSTGVEREVLAYDEAHAAEHDGNLWSELVPSVAVDPAASFLVYVADSNVVRRDLASGTDTILLSVEPNPSGEALPSAWLTASGERLCCAYALASPSIGPAGRAMLLMSQWEGSTMASVGTDGSTACEIDLPGVSFFGFAGMPDWSARGDLGTASWGAYDTWGVFVTPADTPCTASVAAQGDGREGTGYEDAAWSPDGDWLAVAALQDYGGETPRALTLVAADGSSQETLVPDGRNQSPLFSPDGQRIYFVRTNVTHSALWVYDIQSRVSTELTTLPEGWWAAPDGWTTDGYMIVRLGHGCLSYRSCGNRVAVMDAEDGSVVYLSGQRDFSAYMGFIE